MKLNALVIGLGKIGLGFDLKSRKADVLTHTKAYLNNRDFELLAGVDINPAKRRAFEGYSGKKAYKDLDAFRMENKGRVDIISLCTPDNIRLSEIKKAVGLKPKIMIIEKPIALTMKEGVAIKEIARKNKVKVYVNYMRRSDPFYSGLKEKIDSGVFSFPVSAVVNYTGGLYRNASHFLDLMIFYFGSPARVEVLWGHNFILRYKGFNVLFNNIKSGYSVAEMDIFFRKGRVNIREEGVGVKYSAYVSGEDHVFKGFNTLRKTSLKIKSPKLYRYQANVLDEILRGYAKRGEFSSSAGSSLLALEVCEKVKNGI